MLALLPDVHQQEEVALNPHVTFQWIYGGQAFLISLTSTTKEAIDTYMEAYLAAVYHGDVDTPVLAFQDFSHPSLMMTPYLRMRLEMLVTAIEESKRYGHSVILYHSGLLGRSMQVFGNVFAPNAGDIQQQWVLDREQAFQSLEQWV